MKAQPDINPTTVASRSARGECPPSRRLPRVRGPIAQAALAAAFCLLPVAPGSGQGRAPDGIEPGAHARITRVAQIRRLSAQPSRLEPGVELLPVITYGSSAWGMTFFQDSTRGIFLLASLPVGSLIESTGVWSVETDTYRNPAAYRWLRSARDIVVLGQPTLWTGG
jgi:hypothetical protein